MVVPGIQQGCGCGTAREESFKVSHGYRPQARRFRDRVAARRWGHRRVVTVAAGKYGWFCATARSPEGRSPIDGAVISSIAGEGRPAQRPVLSNRMVDRAGRWVAGMVAVS